MIMVTERELLFRGDHFEGFRPKNEVDYETRILLTYQWIRREEAEHNPTLKQPIGYGLIVNPSTKQIFAYRRSEEDAKYSEKRLQGDWSLGVGGHIDHIDEIALESVYTIIIESNGNIIQDDYSAIAGVYVDVGSILIELNYGCDNMNDWYDITASYMGHDSIVESATCS